jgi:AcrR family transcriptional regulator
MVRYKAGLRTEARIVDATSELLGSVGLDGTTLGAICDRAGVRAGSFYNLFDSKEEAVLRVVGTAIAAVDPDPDGLHTETLSDLVEAYVAFVMASPNLARIYLQIAVSGALADGKLHERVVRHHEARLCRFVDAVRRGSAVAAGDRESRAELLLATLNGLAFRWVLEPRFDFAGYARLAQQKADR